MTHAFAWYTSSDFVSSDKVHGLNVYLYNLPNLLDLDADWF